MVRKLKKSYIGVVKKFATGGKFLLIGVHFKEYLYFFIGMLARGKVKKLIFATVDKSPHCVQLHYVIKELENAIDISNIEIINYVAVNDKLNEIPLEVISLSKNLSKLKERM